MQLAINTSLHWEVAAAAAPAADPGSIEVSSSCSIVGNDIASFCGRSVKRSLQSKPLPVSDYMWKRILHTQPGLLGTEPQGHELTQGSKALGIFLQFDIIA